MSADRGQEKALAWSKKENFPWPQVMRENVKSHYNFMQYRNRYVPQYVLVDKSGKKVADGLAASLKHVGISK